MKTTATIALIFGLTLGCRAADNFDGYVQQLAATMPERDAVRALHALDDAGVRAFPTLIAHIADSAPAYFPRQDATGIPTVGEACFSILQGHIEGNWPKGFRQFYILSPANAKQWLATHKALSLRQLQLISREESLRRAETELAAQPADLTTKAVAFLREEVTKLKQ